MSTYAKYADMYRQRVARSSEPKVGMFLIISWQLDYVHSPTNSASLRTATLPRQQSSRSPNSTGRSLAN